MTNPILTGEGMTLMQQISERLLPCPVCLRLRPIDEWKIKNGKQRVRIICRHHGMQTLYWNGHRFVTREAQGEQVVNPQQQPCLYCGWLHGGLCWRIKEIEFFPDGVFKRVKLRNPQKATDAAPQWVVRHTTSCRKGQYHELPCDPPEAETCPLPHQHGLEEPCAR